VTPLDVLVDPAQFSLELFGGKGGCAQHTESAGFGDRNHHVAAVRESENRQFTAQSSAQWSFHGLLGKQSL
jgi:hypothetical protein